MRGRHRRPRGSWTQYPIGTVFREPDGVWMVMVGTGWAFGLYPRFIPSDGGPSYEI